MNILQECVIIEESLLKQLQHVLKMHSLLRGNLMFDGCGWQTYDGAATISGHLRGVSAGLKSDNPLSCLVHCAQPWWVVDLTHKGCAKLNEMVMRLLHLFKILQFSSEIFLKQCECTKKLPIQDNNSDASVKS